MAAFELEGKVAVVAGATRGAGRGIACMLGEAGATVYCTGRSIRGHPSPIGWPETIEETAERVTSFGGDGLWAQVDHTQPDQVKLNKNTAILLAYFLSVELRKHNVAAVCITPGYLRSEAMLERFGVTEESWRDGIAKDPMWADSETPYYIGRAVAALAADLKVMRKTGRALSSGWLARDYGFTDIDGRQPPGYYPKEGVFTRRRGFELRAAGLSGLDHLFDYELRARARKLGVDGVHRLSHTEVIREIERLDPEQSRGG